MPTSVNPATGATIAEYDLHDEAHTNHALASVKTAACKWGRWPTSERTALLTALAAKLRKDTETCAQMITSEMGKPISEARAEVEKSAKTLDFYAANAERFLAFEQIETEAALSGVQYDPLGVVLAIMPWNYPFWQFFRFAAPAFAAGNGAVLKHANNVTGSALLIQQIVDEAVAEVEAPAGLLQTLVIDSSSVEPLVADDRIAAVTLTGSTHVGSIVASQAGTAVKKQVLELGGSDPFIVLADADLAQAAAVATKSRFNTTGQSCVNAKRFLVDSSIAEEFVELFVEQAEKLVIGDPHDEETEIGPLAREDIRSTLHDQVTRAIDCGAVLRTGGTIPDGPGAYYPPTVLDHVRPGQPVFDEETFGPVAAVIRTQDVDEAITLANTSEYGLGATIFSADVGQARALASEIECGAVFINGQVASDPRLPFGGVKRSGYGRELSQHGIREFTNAKTIWIGDVQ